MHIIPQTVLITVTVDLLDKHLRTDSEISTDREKPSSKHRRRWSITSFAELFSQLRNTQTTSMSHRNTLHISESHTNWGIIQFDN